MPDPDNSFDIKNWLDRILNTANKELGDSTVPAKLLNGPFSHEIPLKLGQLSFTIVPEAEATIVLFNSKDDLNQDPMEGVIAAGEDPDAVPPIKFTADGAWLAYHATAGVKADGGGDVGALGLHIEGEKVVQLCHYHFHPNRSEKIKDAVSADFASMGFAVRASDLTKLKESEALAYRVRATLSASLEAKWSDALTANLNALSAFLKASTPLAVKVDFGASVKVTVGVTDDFLLVFSAEAEDKICVAVKKGKVSSLSIAPSAGIDLQIANPEAVLQGVNSVLEGIAGASVDKIDALLQETLLSNLSDEQKKLFENLVKRLKVDDTTADLLTLRAHWTELKKHVAERLESVLKEKLSLSFSYEYSRVRAESTLLQVKVPRTDLLSEDTKLHSSLIKTNASILLDWCRSNGVVPDRYLHEDKLTVKKTWGLSISLGKSFKIGGQDIRVLEEVKRTDFAGNTQLSFLGQRGYEGSWIGQKSTWMVDLIADTKTFEAAPRLAGFEFGLTLKWIWEEKELSSEELDRYLDYAEIWRAGGETDEARRELSEFLGKKVNVSLTTTIGNAAFRTILQTTASASDLSNRASIAMAKAMPWSREEARSIVERRARLYSKLWSAYFADPQRGYRDYARLADQILRNTDNGVEVAFLESSIATGSGQTFWNISFAEMIRLNGTEAGGGIGGIDTAWRHFRQAMANLQAGIAGNAPADRVKAAFKDFVPMCTQSLLVRALGVYWIDLAAELDLLGQVQRTLTIEPAGSDDTAGAKAKVIGVPAR